MRRTMMKSKIHRATVTEADLDHVGSITIDRDLMDAADLLPNEKVQVVDLEDADAKRWEPTVVLVDADNRVQATGAEVHGAVA